MTPAPFCAVAYRFAIALGSLRDVDGSLTVLRAAVNRVNRSSATIVKIDVSDPSTAYFHLFQDLQRIGPVTECGLESLYCAGTLAVCSVENVFYIRSCSSLDASERGVRVERGSDHRGTTWSACIQIFVGPIFFDHTHGVS